MPFEKMKGSQGESLLLPSVDRFRRIPLLPCFDLDKYNNIAIAADQIHFTLRGPITPNQDFETTLSEIIRRRPLSSIAQQAVPEGADDRGFYRLRLAHWLSSHA